MILVVTLFAGHTMAEPPGLDELATSTVLAGLADNLSEDMRHNAMRGAAVGYAARAGLARRGWEIGRVLERFAPQLERVFRFEDLMIHEGGFLVQPPVLAETRQAFRLDRSLDRAASAGRHLRIVAGEKILSSPPEWRDFLLREWTDAEAPAAVLFPRTEDERQRWQAWLEEGWAEGTELANMIFLDDLERLTGFFEGLVLWHRLNRQRMVSAPVLALERMAVSGGGDVMRIDESLVTIAARASLVARPDLWRLP